MKTKSEFNISFKICSVIHTGAMFKPTALTAFFLLDMTNSICLGNSPTELFLLFSRSLQFARPWAFFQSLPLNQHTSFHVQFSHLNFDYHRILYQLLGLCFVSPRYTPKAISPFKQACTCIALFQTSIPQSNFLCSIRSKALSVPLQSLNYSCCSVH